MPSPVSAFLTWLVVWKGNGSKPTLFGGAVGAPSWEAANRASTRCSASVPSASAHSRAPTAFERAVKAVTPPGKRVRASREGGDADEIEAGLDGLDHGQAGEQPDAAVEDGVRDPELR